jgi:hypothetical protein
VIIDVTNDLPHTSTHSINNKGLTNAIVDESGVLLYAIAVHMEYMKCAAGGHDIQEYLVVRTHLEGMVSREDIDVDSVCLIDYIVK